MDLNKVSKSVSIVSDKYAKKFGIKRDGNWYILKLQEEMGELIQSYLMMVGSARQKNKTSDEIVEDFHKEMADVFCHVLLLAKKYNVDLEKAVNEKWLVWNKQK